MNPRIAFITDSLPSIGGGEKVLFAALNAYPHADIFTLIYNKKIFANTPLTHRTVHTTWLDALPLAHSHHRYLLPLMPAAIERINLRGYDIVVSFNYAVANGARPHGARHVSYTHTPLRYAWTDININGTHTQRNPLLDFYLRRFRAWDKRAASRLHEIATNSQAVSQRIRLSYERIAPVIYPPVEVERFHPSITRENYYVTLTRLVPHKRLDLLIHAFNKLNLPLLLLGDGPELPRLQRIANSNITFLGFQSDEVVAQILNKARAFVSAAEEDFGIALVEAQAAGCPVITYGSGGALETVIPNETGILFPEQTVDSIIAAVQTFERSASAFDPQTIAANAARFNTQRFVQEFKAFVEDTSQMMVE